MSCLAGFPVGVGMAVASAPLIALLSGPKWAASGPLLAIMALEMIPIFYAMFNAALYRALGHPGWTLSLAGASSALGLAGGRGRQQRQGFRRHAPGRRRALQELGDDGPAGHDVDEADPRDPDEQAPQQPGQARDPVADDHRRPDERGLERRPHDRGFTDASDHEWLQHVAAGGRRRRRHR